MSDTAIQGLGSYTNGRLTIDKKRKRWREALRSDIVVAHVSDTPSGELRHLADFPDANADDGVERFNRSIVELQRTRGDEAMQLIQALSLSLPLNEDDEPEPPLGLLDPGFLVTMEPWDHLYLHGLLAVAKEMRAIRDKRKRVLVVGELREQLGSFRGTIAREINHFLFDRTIDDTPLDREHPAYRPVALTADIGLRIRLTSAGQLVHCSTCASNNDRLPDERFHPPEAIREVCVKGDHEAMYWNCRMHDPSKREPAVFVEQMGSYDPFTAGSRFHG